MAADARPFVSAGMPPYQATEVAEQIGGTGNAVNFVRVGLPTPLASELARQITAGVGDAQSLIAVGASPGLAGVLETAIGTVVPDVPFALSQLPAGSTIDHDPAVGVTAAGSNVSAWAAVGGNGTLTATGSPQLDTASDGLPRVTFSGVDGGPYMTGDEAHFDRWADFLVVDRPNANQNAVATNKVFYQAPRASDGANTVAYMLRVTNDAEQDDIVFSGIGAGAGTAAGVFPKGSRRLLRFDRFQTSRLSVDGTSVGTVTNVLAGTSTQTILGGATSSTSARAAISFLRRMRVNTNALPGTDEQVWNLWVIEGFLAWAYNKVADLRSDHPFKGRPPLASDYTGNNKCIIGLGNSLVNGPMSQMATAYNAGTRGVTTENQGVSGEKPEQIYARFLAFTAAQKKKIFWAGDGWANPGDGSVNYNTAYFDIINDVQTTHGYGAGLGHIVATGRWIGFIDGQTEIGSPLRTTIDAYNATVAAAYPNYYWDAWGYMVNLGRPGGPYEDAVAYAKGWIPSVLRQGYPTPDSLHLNSTGQLLLAQGMVSQFIEPKGWDR